MADSKTKKAKPKKRSLPARTDPSPVRSGANKADFYVTTLVTSGDDNKSLEEILDTAAASAEMAFIVVVTSSDPAKPAEMVKALSRNSAIPIRLGKEGAAIEPRTVLVIGKGNFAISDGSLKRAAVKSKDGVREPVTEFLESFARYYRDLAVTVILGGDSESGLAAGFAELKVNGGLTLAQEPSSTDKAMMPERAIATGFVDIVLPASEIGDELVGLSKIFRSTGAPETALRAGAKDRESLLALLYSVTKVDFSAYKQPTVWRRISRRMALRRVSSVSEYLEFCKKNPAELGNLHEEILIHVTGFFRDAEVFSSLVEKTFPRILELRSTEDPIRMWIPGCATGEEVYSFAISWLEYLASRKLNIPLQLFGTDLGETAIEIARTGKYESKISQSVSAERLEKFFIKVNNGYQVNKTVRDLCVFARQNLVADPPLSRMDFISCRNLLIYFGPELQRKAVSQLHYALKPNGFLMLGKSEVIDSFGDLFTSEDNGHKLYRKKLAFSSGVNMASGKFTSLLENEKKNFDSNQLFIEADTQREMDRLIATRYSPPALTIDENLNILQVRGDINPFLNIGSGRWQANLTRLVQHDLVKVIRELIDKSINGKKSVLSVNDFRIRFKEDFRSVDIKFISLRSLGDKEKRFLLVFETNSESSKPSEVSDIHPKRSVQLKRELVHLEEEVKVTREYLQAAVDESEIRNEDLRAANEEILSHYEELQTVNQELETSKEQLEASNEELVTLNEELQHHIERLKSSEERFRLLVSQVKDYAIFMLDPNGKILSWNEGAQRLKGYTADEAIGKHFSIFSPPDVARSGKLKEELHIASTQGSYSEEGIRVRKDGSRFWAQVVITALFNDKGEVYGFAKVTRDVTEKRLAEEKLKLSEERFRILVSGVKDYAIFMMDTGGNILSWNEGARRLKGYNADDIIGKHFSIFYTEKDKNRLHPQHELEIARREGKYEEEGPRVRKDGTLFSAHILITALYDEHKVLRGFGKVTRDVTAKNKADEMLRLAYNDLEHRVQEAKEVVRAQSSQIRLITNAIPALIAYIDLNDKYTFTNKEFEHWFGAEPESFVGKFVYDVFGQRLFTKIAQPLADAHAGHASEFETELAFDGGPSRYVRILSVPDFDPEKAVRGVIQLIEDISERKRHEENLKKYSDDLARTNMELKSSNTELSQFAHVSSHDLKEPLRMVKSYTQMIAHRYSDKLDEKGLQYVSYIVEGASRMEALINDLLAYSAVGRSTVILTSASLTNSVNLALSNLRELIDQTKAEVTVEELPVVKGNETQLAQVFQNLIGNAIKFTRAGVTPKVLVTAEQHEGMWRICVSDNGIGIETKYFEKIFVIFQRLHERSQYPGTGIGLAICKRIIERHGGQIWVTSRVGHGAQFYFSVPPLGEQSSGEEA